MRLLRLLFLPENAAKEMANVQRDVFKEEEYAQHTRNDCLYEVASAAGIYVEQGHHAK
jgi:hypothetical protein